MGVLDGRAVVVTGAGRGIGRAIALKAAAEGGSIVVVDSGCEPDGTGSNPAVADAVVQAITSAGGKAVAVHDDVSTMAGGEAAVKVALDNYGQIDALITCAGIRRDAPIWEMTEEDWDTVITAGTKSGFAPVKFATIAMRQQRYGRIVMMVSDAGLGAVGASNYAAASEGALGLARTVARDVGRYGVTCNAISPLARTRMSGGMSEELRPPAGVLSADATARIAPPPPTLHWEAPDHPDDPKSVAPLAVYLASEGSGEINGQLFGVRGGDVLLYSQPTIDRQILSYGRRFTLDELDEQMPRTLALDASRPVLA
ncbi:MAG: SDR family NAD(P)-dependent oxidoreductase [Chloroflexi bacterium]|nr:SDR family NAD(P)-dependent oxidoreductase [Chloroflexota bacterium]MDA1002268.1 SDR family NAD(P)-dependent oxidoreductase [Chloroflexota bacterium]